MDLHETDFSHDALETALRISQGIDELAAHMQAGDTTGAEINALLLSLLVDTRDLLDYIAPLISPGEIHGLPKHASDPDRPAPIVFRRSDPSISFDAWWLEKTSRIHRQLFWLATVLRAENTQTEASLIDLNMREIQHVIAAVIDLLNAGGLTISELKIGDGE